MTVTNWEENVTVRCNLISCDYFPRYRGRLSANYFPDKFLDDGNVGPCHGMTIVCPIPKHSTLYTVASTILSKIRNHPDIAPYCGVLADDSLHMTVADLIFSENLAKVQHNYPVLHNRLSEVMKSAPWTTFTMSVEKFNYNSSLQLCMTPYTEETNQSLKNWRNAVYSACDNICSMRPGYGFHVTLAYLIYAPKNAYAQQALKELQQQFNLLLQGIGPVVLGPPVLSVFEHMNAFPPYKSQ